MAALSVTEGDVGLRIVNLRKSYRKRVVIVCAAHPLWHFPAGNAAA